jgi:hypothetical protein
MDCGQVGMLYLSLEILGMLEIVDELGAVDASL